MLTGLGGASDVRGAQYRICTHGLGATRKALLPTQEICPQCASSQAPRLSAETLETAACSSRGISPRRAGELRERLAEKVASTGGSVNFLHNQNLASTEKLLSQHGDC